MASQPLGFRNLASDKAACATHCVLLSKDVSEVDLQVFSLVATDVSMLPLPLNSECDLFYLQVEEILIAIMCCKVKYFFKLK